MTTNETHTEPDTEATPEIGTMRLPEPPVNILDSQDDEPVPETSKIAYLLYVDHTSYQHVIGVALDNDEANEFIRLANKGRYGELVAAMPVELLALPHLWKH
jgi:hypothetical protein